MKMLKISLLLAVMLTSFAFANEAEAKRRLVVKNNTPETVYVAYSFLNQHNVWERRAWLTVPPNSPVYYTLNSNNNTMYVYARSKSRVWQGYEGDPNSIWLSVVDRHFQVKGNAKLTGAGLRNELFEALIIDGGTDFNINYNLGDYHD